MFIFIGRNYDKCTQHPHLHIQRLWRISVMHRHTHTHHLRVSFWSSSVVSFISTAKLFFPRCSCCCCCWLLSLCQAICSFSHWMWFWLNFKLHLLADNRDEGTYYIEPSTDEYTVFCRQFISIFLLFSLLLLLADIFINRTHAVHRQWTQWRCIGMEWNATKRNIYIAIHMKIPKWEKNENDNNILLFLHPTTACMGSGLVSTVCVYVFVLLWTACVRCAHWIPWTKRTYRCGTVLFHCTIRLYFFRCRFIAFHCLLKTHLLKYSSRVCRHRRRRHYIFIVIFSLTKCHNVSCRKIKTAHHE